MLVVSDGVPGRSQGRELECQLLFGVEGHGGLSNGSRRPLLLESTVERSKRLGLPKRFLNDLNLKIQSYNSFNKLVQKLVVETFLALPPIY